MPKLFPEIPLDEESTLKTNRIGNVIRYKLINQLFLTRRDSLGVTTNNLDVV
jgi:hypothetical protein